MILYDFIFPFFFSDICTEILKFIGIYSKEFGLKIGLPSAVIFLIGLLLAILLCLLASGMFHVCFKDI